MAAEQVTGLPPEDADDDLSTGPFRTAEAEPMAIEDIRDAMVVRENGTFLLTDKNGNVPEGNGSGYGLYRSDTRFLSAYEFQCLSAPLVMLLSNSSQGYAAEQVLTNPAFTTAAGRQVARETIEVRRRRLIDGALRETVEITNFNLFPVGLSFGYRFAADFADLFAVRGLKPGRRGTMSPPDVAGRCIRFHYEGLDAMNRWAEIEFDTLPDQLEAGSAAFSFRLGPRECRTLGLTVHIGERPLQDAGGGLPPRSRRAPDSQRLAAEYRDWRDGCTRVFTSNDIFNAVLDQSLSDVRTLWNHQDGGTGNLAAGTPWFDTLFGRDSLITSLQLLAFNPVVAKESLLTLASHQGTVLDDWRDEQPGKILHELRNGEMARTGEVPFSRYYGSIDSTPLFLLLAAEYWRWTADRGLLRRLEPNLVACLEWIEGWGDRDSDGYVEYQRELDKGLLNQGWKDSGEAIVHADGRLAKPPIALAEVQAYVYAGLIGLAEIADALRRPALAARCRKQAQQLHRRYNRDFWMPGERFYALALDGDKRQVESISSNPGHALFSGIVPQRRGAAVAGRLMRPDMFSGWGVRTLSADSRRFNPMGYHVGTIWPHDNSLLAAGLKRYGQEAALAELATAIYDAARAMEYYRLPELFCGSQRTADAQPVPYPVACRPQAWAAGTIPLVLASLLGLSPDAARGELSIVRPQLPYWLQRVDVRNLRVGTDSADLLFELHGHRTRVTILQTTGKLRVTVLPGRPA